MNVDSEQPSGEDNVPGTVRRVAATLLRVLRNRTELLGLELEEEGRWVVAALVWTAAAIFFTVLTIVIVTIAVVMTVPESARLWVLGGFSLIYLFLAISAVSGLKKHIHTRRPPLADTVNEFKKDLEWIQPRE